MREKRKERGGRERAPAYSRLPLVRKRWLLRRWGERKSLLFQLNSQKEGRERGKKKQKQRLISMIEIGGGRKDMKNQFVSKEEPLFLPMSREEGTGSRPHKEQGNEKSARLFLLPSTPRKKGTL